MSWASDMFRGYRENTPLLTYVSSDCQNQRDDIHAKQHYALSSERDYELTLESVLDNTPDDSPLSRIYLSEGERQFYGNQLKKKYDNPIQRVVDEYDSLRVKPYAKIRDASDPLGTGMQEGMPKPCVEIGIRFGF